MRRIYLWELPTWPNYTYDLPALIPIVTEAAERFGELSGALAQATAVDRRETEVRALVADAVDTSAIEGERLDPEAVRGSIVRRLSLPGTGVRRPDDRTEGVIDITLDALDYQKPVTERRLFEWHERLFPIVRNQRPLRNIGCYRDDADGAMTVQTNRGAGRPPIIHYEAPSAEQLQSEMRSLLEYIESDTHEDGSIRAAIVHLWFLLIHPFEDGNGRIARALADLMLGRARGEANRYCSLSRQLLLDQKDYYQELELAGYQTLDITCWIQWFLGCYSRALVASNGIIGDVLKTTRFFAGFRDVEMNARQRKIVRTLLDGFDAKLNAARYAHINQTSHDTANRDLADLVKKGILLREGGSKNTAYKLAVLAA
jgi:Fic family protein